MKIVGCKFSDCGYVLDMRVYLCVHLDDRVEIYPLVTIIVHCQLGVCIVAFILPRGTEPAFLRVFPPFIETFGVKTWFC